MTKSKKQVKTKLKAVKSDSHASRMLKVLRATGLFRWERPSTKSEEVLNILTHGIGIGLALAAQNTWAIVSCAIFGLTMFTLYFGSTMCHAMIGQKSECFFEVWDSVAIYALIAGTYTPFCLVNLRGGFWHIVGDNNIRGRDENRTPKAAAKMDGRALSGYGLDTCVHIAGNVASYICARHVVYSGGRPVE